MYVSGLASTLRVMTVENKIRLHSRQFFFLFAAKKKKKSLSASLNDSVLNDGILLCTQDFMIPNSRNNNKYLSIIYLYYIDVNFIMVGSSLWV